MATYTATTIKDMVETNPAEGCTPAELNDCDRETRLVVKNQYSIISKTASYTLTGADHIILCNGTFAITLPTASTVASATYTKEYVIKNVGTGTITITGTIDAVVNPTLTSQYESMIIATDGTSWYELRVKNASSVGVVGILQGGTGQTTAVPAFDALAPTTTAGDMVYHNGTDNVRLGIGTSLQQLRTNTGATAPEWFTPTSGKLAGDTVQVVNYSTGAYASTLTTMPNDDTIPQNTEGVELMTLAITPTSATNKLRIQVKLYVASGGDMVITSGLFQDAISNALTATSLYLAANWQSTIILDHYMTAGSVSEIVFKVRFGGSSGASLYLNGNNTGRLLGGVANSSITITEVQV